MRAKRTKLLSLLTGAAIAVPICGQAGRAWAAYEPPVKQIEQSSSSTAAWHSVTADERDLIAHVVEAEAGDQDLTGKRLVVDVILNRRDRGNEWPDDIRGVITQRHQFSTWPRKVQAADPSPESYIAVDMETGAGSRLDATIHYFDCGGYIPGCEPAYRYGGHYFGR